MGQTDLSSNSLISHPDVFADIINAAVYGGRQVLDGTDLRPYYGNESAVKENIQIPGVQLTGELTLTQPPEDPLETCFNRFVERTLEDEKQTAL